MHARCYATWPESKEFDRLYAEALESGRALNTPERRAEMLRRRAEAREAQAGISRVRAARGRSVPKT